MKPSAQKTITQKEFIKQICCIDSRLDALETAVGIEDGTPFTVNNVLFAATDGSITEQIGVPNRFFTYDPAGGNLTLQFNQHKKVTSFSSIQSVDYGSGGSNELEFFQGQGTLASPSASLSGDTMGWVAFTGRNSANQNMRFSCGFRGVIIDPAAGVETSYLAFWTSKPGTSTIGTTARRVMSLGEQGATNVRFHGYPQTREDKATQVPQGFLYTGPQGYVWHTRIGGSYADDTAAAAGGVALGTLYWNTTSAAVKARLT